MIRYNTLVVLLGTGLLGVNAGLVGVFAVLRRRALTGDALAHAALPGLCVAFLLAGERSLPVLLLGAFLSGILGVAVITALRRWTRIKEDASIGIVLSVFFGAGMALLVLIQHHPNFSAKASGLNSYIFGKAAGMIAEDVYLIAGAALVCLILLGLLYKEFKLIAFDPGFAVVEGWPVFGLDLLLMALVSLTVVIGLPAVGVVLVAALLILPGASARFWTERLSRMLVLSALFGLSASVVGTLLSANFDNLPAGPAIILVGTAIFIASALLAPQRGILARWLSQRQVREELARNAERFLEGSQETAP